MATPDPDEVTITRGDDTWGVSTESVRAQLTRILRSQTFSNAPSLSRFLSYVVEHTLQGRADRIKEYTLGVEVFDRGESFDPRTDTIVRVQARRLRRKLKEYYESEGRSDPILIDLPKGRYIPLYQATASPSAVLETPLPETESRADNVRPLPKPKSRALVLALITALALAALGAGLLLWRPGEQQHSAKNPRISSVAVLPFTDLSPSKDKEYFAYGLAEEIMTRLTRIPNLWVVGRISAFALGQSPTPAVAAADRKIQALVTGSVRVQGDQLRVTAQLVETPDERSLWSQTYEGRSDDTFRIQDEIADAVSKALRTSIPSLSGAQRAIRRTTNLAAYNRYLQAIYIGRTVRPDSLAKAIRIQEEIIRLEPNFAPAYAWLAYFLGQRAAFVGFDYRADLKASRGWAARAIELDPELPDPYCALGHVAMLEMKWDEARRMLRKALELNPNFSLAHELYALYLMSQGRTTESLEEIEIACQLEPLALLAHWNRGFMLFMARRYDEALEALTQAQELGPDFSTIDFTRARIYLQKGNCPEAIAADKRLVLPGRVRYIHPIIIARCRSAEEGRAAVAEWERTEQPRPSSRKAMVYAALGERERALDILEEAVSNPNDRMDYINVIPELDSLRSEPRFARILKRMGLKN